MHPYQNNTIANTTMVGKHGEGYSDLIDHDLNQRVYIDRPIINPIQPSWIAPNTNNSTKNQHSNNYNQMYNNNYSYMMTSPSVTSISTGGYISSNDTYAPPLLVGSSTSSLQSISSTSACPQHYRQNSDTVISDNYIISNNSNHHADYSIQHGNNAMPLAACETTNQFEYSPSPSPPPPRRSNSIVSDSSHPSSQYQDYEEKEFNNDKKSSSEKAPVKKREKALERNRQAALRCRQRKKEWLNQLQSNVEVLTKENRILEQQSISLREEILNLKTVLLAHRDCSHAHITAESINIDHLLYRSSSAAASSSSTTLP